MNINDIYAYKIQIYIIHLQHRQTFIKHPFTSTQEGYLSGHAVSGYIRALRTFWSWDETGGHIIHNSYNQVKVPKVPKKVMPTAAIRKWITSN